MAETDTVELVDEEGRPVGQATVAEAHAAPGLWHRAFSVLVHDGAGSVLLQRRALAKTRFGGQWANACCGHVAPGADVVGSALIRTREELGLVVPALEQAGIHRYTAPDPTSGMVECEHDHVLVAQLDRDVRLAPDPAEVEETRWVPVLELLTEDGSAPDALVPWLRGVLEVAVRHLDAAPGSAR